MKLNKRLLVLGLFLLAFLTAGHLLWPGRGAAEAASLAFDAGDCHVVIEPPQSIQAAIDTAGDGQTLCVRGGVYNQSIVVPSTKSNLTLIAYPGEQPIIDGQKQLPGGPPTRRFAPLVSLAGPGTVFDGFEVRFSTARGVEVNGNNAIVRNSSIHDNWELGLIVRRSIENPVSGVLIENNRVFRNLLKARYIPVIYRGTRSGSGPTDWTFDPEELWNAPFWTGSDKDLPDTWINGISMTFNDDGRTSRVYAGSARSGRVGYIGPEHSATGQQVSYSGADILFHNPATNLWTIYFNGDSMGSRGLNGNAVIDAFQIEGQSAPPECPACTPIIMSFAVTSTVPISGTSLTIGPSDLVRFSPTAIGNVGQITAGNFSLYRRAADLALPPGANIDALDRTPDGQLLASMANDLPLGDVIIGEEDLALFDATTATWSLYFDGENIPYNPFPDDLKAAWLDAAGNIYVSGDPVGGSALTFLYAQDSIARGNHVYNNHGEGLVAGRYSARITLEDNVLYDNDHANMYLNATNYPLVQRNVVFCTDDPMFWRKGSAPDYRPGPGIQIRDEDFEGQDVMPPPSQGQVIINNLVVGCSTNFGVATQRADGQGGLIDALVANNTFANARGETGTGINNVEFNRDASYDNSRFINNLILQTTPGSSAQAPGNRDAFGTLTLANNLYSVAPKSGWPGGESGRLIAAPLFAGGEPPLPAMSALPDPADYRLSYSSPAFDSGLSLAEVGVDIFGQSRAATGLLDRGAHELPYVGAIVVTQQTTPAQADQSFGYTASYTPNTFVLRHGQQFDSGPLPVGDYSVTVDTPAGWTSSAQCDGGQSPEAITLAPGQTVTCAFHSERLSRLIVTNATQPANDPQPFDFTLSPGEAFQLTGGASQPFDLSPGSYALSATTPNGWARIGATCDNGQSPASLSLASGDVVTCTFTHSKLGRIVVEKQTQPDGATQAFAFTTSYDSDGFTLSDGQRDTSAGLSPGSHAVAETLPAGWAQISATCDDSSAPAAIDLGPGETVTCTFINARLGLGLTITPTPGQVTAPGGAVSFAVAVSNSGAAALELTGLSDSVFGNVADAGNAALSATTCTLPQPLPVGQEYTCAFTATVSGAGGSTQRNTLTATAAGQGGATVNAAAEAQVIVATSAPGRIIVIAQTDPANTPGSFVFSAGYAPGGFSLSHGQSHDSGPLPAGAMYSVSQNVPTGWTLASATCAGDDDGTNPASIQLDSNETVTCTFLNQRTITGPTAMLYVSAPTAGTVGGVAYAVGDIVAYNGLTGAWSLYFDGSDVGWTKAIGDFELLPDGSLLLTNSAKQTLGPAGARFTLQVQDIARFVPTATGATTAGAWELYFDGSDVLLSTADERIDALARKPDGTLLISTAGRATVKSGSTSIVAQDEDLLAFRPTRTGATTAGAWSLAFDGSLLTGMTAENVTGAWHDGATGDLYLTLVNAFTIGGVAGNQRSVLRVTPARAVSLYWNAATNGYSGALDGLGIAP